MTVGLQKSERNRVVKRLVTHYFPALLVTVIVILSVGFADRQNLRYEEEALRNNVGGQLGIIRQNLERDIRNNIERLLGLAVAIETEPKMTQERFSAFAKRLMLGKNELRSMAAAPDMVVQLVYPLVGNEKVIGLDYRKNGLQREAAFTVVRERRMVVTGPVDLVQGGRGLIARFPVANPDAAADAPLWGVMSGVIDLDKLYQSAGLRNKDMAIDVAIKSNVSRPHAPPLPFFGDPAVFQDNPVLMTINFGHETWSIAARPKAGWSTLPDSVSQFRAMLILAGLLVIIPMIWAGRLMEERETNIDQLQERENQLNALSHRLEIALQTSKIGVWEYHVNEDRLIWDERMRDLYGIPQAKLECTYQDWKNALHPDDLEEAEAQFAFVLEHGGTYSCDFRVVTAGGEIRVIRAIGDTIVEGNGLKKIVGVNWNVTQDVQMRDDLEESRQRTEEQNRELEIARGQMEYIALHDTLTKLPNRRYLDRMLSDRNQQDRKRHIAILHVDLDRFKEINDTLGHAAGDEMLKHAARTLKAGISRDDFVARIGGDEFVIVSLSENDIAEHGKLANRLIEAMSSPVFYDGHEIRTGVSIGIAVQSDHDHTFEDVLINADIALYEAKRRGRNRFEYFTDSLRAAVIATRQTADEILRGLENKEFVSWFQPQFDARTLEIVGVEALVRWDHPQKGIIAPAMFLPIAENLNVMAQIDQLVLEQALLQFNRWQAAGLDIPRVSVNISSQRLQDETLLARLEKMSLKPGTVCFELLESISFDENDANLEDNIARIKALGIDIEIDDFGTGYASIVSLLKLSPKRLKIDRQLVMPILQSPVQQQMVSSIIDIGLARGMEIVAEGVETMAHAEILRDLGCHALQGYVFARPMSANDFIKFVRQRSWMPETDHPKQAIA